MKIDQWRKNFKEMSASLATNGVMPDELVDKLLDEDISLKDKLSFEEVAVPKFDGILVSMRGLNILAYLQKKKKDDCLTVFRAVRFPTYKRIYEMVSQHGYAVSNYEQGRILKFYQDQEYVRKREEIMKDSRFWTQPQERVVHGLPLFALVNDALQIHYSFRGDEDAVAMVAVHVPHQLLESKKIKLMANAAIDLDYQNTDRDYEIKDFVKKANYYDFEYSALRSRGIDLHELYSQDLPLSIVEAKNLGIEQEFFLLNTYRITDGTAMHKLKQDTKTLKENAYFLHGFWGDQNIFARREAKYLPVRCQTIHAR